MVDHLFRIVDNLTPPLALFDSLGGLEMLVIFVLSLMLFGGKRLPEVAKGLGKSIREFKRAASGVEDEIRRAMDLDHSPHRRPPVRRPRSAVKAPADPAQTPAPEPYLPPPVAPSSSSQSSDRDSPGSTDQPDDPPSSAGPSKSDPK